MSIFGDVEEREMEREKDDCSLVVSLEWAAHILQDFCERKRWTYY
jgi:hypothetical protein